MHCQASEAHAALLTDWRQGYLTGIPYLLVTLSVVWKQSSISL